MTLYFKYDTFPGSKFCTFLNIPIPGNDSPGYFEVFKSFNMTPKTFCEKANSLFDQYNIKVPQDYKIFNADEFAVCVSCCIVMQEKYSIDVQKIIKNELIEGTESKDLYHACSLASVALYYLNQGYEVSIIKEKSGIPNPDLVISGKECEIKVIQEADWITNYDPKTGKTEEHELFLDICYDIGSFISKRGSGYKGIKQAQIVFADLSQKSIGWLKKVLEDDDNFENEFPELQENRIILFARRILNFTGFHVDFDPRLWKLIKEKKIKHRFAILPFNTKD